MKSFKNQFGSVYYVDSNGERKKIAYRINVENPTYARTKQDMFQKYDVQTKKNHMKIFNANKVRYNRLKKICGRGSYEQVPIDKIFRVRVNKMIYRIK